MPFFVISVAYTLIAIELNRSVNDDVASIVQKKRRKETQKVVRMLLIVTSVFAFCILPFHLVALCSSFATIKSFQYINEVHAISYLILFSHSACNPVIYNLFNEKFRSSFAEFFEECFRRKKNHAQQPRPSIVSSDNESIRIRVNGKEDMTRFLKSNGEQFA